MKIDILTIFPDFINIINSWSIIGRAVEKNILTISTTNIRDYSKNKHRKVDDYPYGGGPGMVMTPQPIFDSIDKVREENSKVIYLSPRGRKLSQKILNELSKEEHLILLCGHYEGIDNRVIENYIDEEISIGDYVLSGGEIPAMVLIDGITRLLPGALSSEESYKDDSHYKGLLEYPQYTRPSNFRGIKVPEILLSGDHERIREWRKKKSLKTTLIRRPDLFSEYDLDKKELDYIEQIKTQENLTNKLK